MNIYSGRVTARITAPNQEAANELFYKLVSDEDIIGVELIEFDVLLEEEGNKQQCRRLLNWQ